MAFLLDTSASLTEEAIELHDRLIGQYHSQTKAPRERGYSYLIEEQKP